MSILSWLFGTGAATSQVSVAEEYKGMRITPQLGASGKSFRIGAQIECDVDGETLVHHLIRADTIQDEDDATKASIAKAKQVIDEQGKTLFR